MRSDDPLKSIRPARIAAAMRRMAGGVFVERYVFGVILVFILMAITIPLYVYMYRFGGDASQSGPFGDTIGGLAGPIMAMLSAILIFLSFKKQAESNRLLIDSTNRSEAINSSTLILSEVSSEISRIEQEYNGAQFKVKEKDGTYTIAQGIYAFDKMLKAFRKDNEDPATQLVELERYLIHNSAFHELVYIQIQCQSLFYQIKATITETRFRKIALRKLTLFYRYKVNYSIDKIEDYICQEIYTDRASGQAAIAALPSDSRLKLIIVENEELCQAYRIDHFTLDNLDECLDS